MLQVLRQMHHTAAGPPASRPRKNADLRVREVSQRSSWIEDENTNLTAPIKFKEQKLTAKLSTKCQVRCKDYSRTMYSALQSSGPNFKTKFCSLACNRVVAKEKNIERKNVSNSCNCPTPEKGEGDKLSATLGASLRRSER